MAHRGARGGRPSGAGAEFSEQSGGDTTAIVDALGPFTPAYVEHCRVARLRRHPGQVGAEARRLERGDFYAWRLGPPGVAGGVLVSQIVEPRTAYIADDRLWWTPRLDQLLHRVEVTARKHADVPGDCCLREWIAQQLASRLRQTADSWEEAALELLLDDGAEPVAVRQRRERSSR